LGSYRLFSTPNYFRESSYLTKVCLNLDLTTPIAIDNPVNVWMSDYAESVTTIVDRNSTVEKCVNSGILDDLIESIKEEKIGNDIEEPNII